MMMQQLNIHQGKHKPQPLLTHKNEFNMTYGHKGKKNNSDLYSVKADIDRK